MPFAQNDATFNDAASIAIDYFGGIGCCAGCWIGRPVGTLPCGAFSIGTIREGTRGGRWPPEACGSKYCSLKSECTRPVRDFISASIFCCEYSRTICALAASIGTAERLRSL